MLKIEEQIEQYALLSPEERQEVDTYVAAHPEWTSALDEAKRLAALLRDARLLDEAPPGDEALAYYLAAQGLGPTSGAQDVYHRIEAQIEADPALRARADALAERLRELDAASDPVAQFERLSGYKLPPPPPGDPPTSEARTSDPKRAADRAPRRTSGEGRRTSSLNRWVRRTSVLALALVGLYGALFAFSQATTPTYERLAAFRSDEVRTDIYGRPNRGGTPQADTLSIEALFLEALPLLQEARTSTLGLFPRYDEAKLERAAELLEQIIAREPPGFTRAEAYYLLGKARLAQGDVEAARDALRPVAYGEEGAGPGRQDEAAERLLEALPEQQTEE